MSELDHRANTHMNNCKHWFGSECSCNMSEASVELADLRARTTWQPIETAPKKKVILLYSDGIPVPVVGEKNFMLDGKIVWHGIDQYGRFIVFPTHWMPLPEPPEEK